jgi:excinuclease ABC subunit B
MIAELGYCAASRTTRATSRAASRRAAALPVRLPAAESLLVIDESHVTLPQLQACTAGTLAQGNAGRVRLPAAVGARQPAAAFDEFERVQPQTIYVSATPAVRS